MKFVEIYKIDNDGKQSVLVTCILTSGGLKIEGEQSLINNLNNGIQNYSEIGDDKVYPKDGILFLEQLKFNFKSGYLNASEVKEI